MSKKKREQALRDLMIKNIRDELEIGNALKQRELRQNKEIAEKELKVKDRVDISLKEYKELKQRNEALESDVDFYEGLYKELKIEPFLSNIEWQTLTTKTWRDVQTNKLKVSITFDVEELM